MCAISEASIPSLKATVARLALIHAIGSEPETEEVSDASVGAAIAQIEYFKGQAARVVSHISQAVGVGTVGGKDYKVWLCREWIIKGFREGRFQSRRDAQRMANYSAEIFREAWDSLVQPSRLIESAKDIYSLHEEGDLTDSLTDTEGSTDTPTTDTGESAA